MLIVNTDASVKSNAGTGIGWHIQTWGDDEDTLLKTKEKGFDSLTGQYTTMEAELLALIRGVKEAIQMEGSNHIRLRSDCKPLVEKVKNNRPLCDGQYMEALQKLLERVDKFDLQWVSREKNSCADRQAVVGRDQYA